MVRTMTYLQMEEWFDPDIVLAIRLLPQSVYEAIAWKARKVPTTVLRVRFSAHVWGMRVSERFPVWFDAIGSVLVSPCA